jgi:hypothetical protein
MRSRLRPLVVRPGTEYACFGDGICCTDAHALGPVTRLEKKRLKLAGAETYFHPGLEADVLVTGDDGKCAELKDERCAIHGVDGDRARPSACKRFPVGLVGTPDGGRVTTEHRCPCRTMGQRPELLPEDAERSLVDGRGRLISDGHAPETFEIDKRTALDWPAYVAFENAWMERAARMRDPVAMFGVKPYPKLDGLEWSDAAHVLRSERDGTRGGEALAMFGDWVLAETTGEPYTARARPWTDAFDRAEARSPKRRDPVAMWMDYVLDGVWSLRWTDRLTWKHSAIETTTRVHVGMGIAEALVRDGAREDRAAAEAIFVAEIVGATSTWSNLVLQMRTR